MGLSCKLGGHVRNPEPTMSASYYPLVIPALRKLETGIPGACWSAILTPDPLRYPEKHLVPVRDPDKPHGLVRDPDRF